MTRAVDALGSHGLEPSGHRAAPEMVLFRLQTRVHVKLDIKKPLVDLNKSVRLHSGIQS